MIRSLAAGDNRTYRLTPRRAVMPRYSPLTQTLKLEVDERIRIKLSKKKNECECPHIRDCADFPSVSRSQSIVGVIPVPNILCDPRQCKKDEEAHKNIG